MSSEELFITLIAMSLVLSFILGGLGCGEQCIETPDCGCASGETDEAKAQINYLTIPGCGGCLTYKWGLNTCLYSQKCDYTCGKIESGEMDLNGYSDNAAFDASFVTCDNIFYGCGALSCNGDCMVCTGYEHRYYSGIFFGSIDGEDVFLCYDGTTPDYDCDGCSYSSGKGTNVYGYYDGWTCGGVQMKQDEFFCNFGKAVRETIEAKEAEELENAALSCASGE